MERAEGAWHLRDQSSRADEAWHGHYHYREPLEAPVDEELVADEPGEAVAVEEADEPPGPNVALIVGVAFVLVGLAMMAVAYLGPDETRRVEAAGSTTSTVMSVPQLASGTTSPTTPLGIGVGVGPEVNGRLPLRGYGEASVTIVSGKGKVCEECVLTAFTSEQRQRGLTRITDPTLGGYSGMLFEFPIEVRGSFWMRNTPIPLSVAFFDEDGRLVSTVDMEPCGDSDKCPRYSSKGDFKFALEVPQGTLPDIGVEGDAHLRIDSRRCPPPKAGG